MTTARTLYFAYGSNLWKDQMASRCPDSPFIGVGRLRGYHWFINARGYANVAETKPRPKASNANYKAASSTSPRPRAATAALVDDDDDQEEDYANQVWGLVYALSPADEARLDRNEGVPYAYEKLTLTCELWVPGPPASAGGRGAGWRAVPMLVYVDARRREGGHRPRDEYVRRMNMGIRDALREGVPRGYVDTVLRRYIPPEEEALMAEDGAAGKAGSAWALAARQARGFREESEIVGVAGGSVRRGGFLGKGKS